MLGTRFVYLLIVSIYYWQDQRHLVNFELRRWRLPRSTHPLSNLISLFVILVTYFGVSIYLLSTIIMVCVCIIGQPENDNLLK